MTQLPSDRLERGDHVVAYGKYPAEIIGERLSYNAYPVRTEPIAIPGAKRRRRMTMVVPAASLEKIDA